MNQNNCNDELKHYGVLGMKWGRRKNRYISKDSKRVSNIRKKRVNQMSNEELQKVNKRLELENRYSNLRSQRNVGKKVIQAFIATGTTIVAVEGAAKAYKKVAELAVKKLATK